MARTKSTPAPSAASVVAKHRSAGLKAPSKQATKKPAASIVVSEKRPVKREAAPAAADAEKPKQPRKKISRKARTRALDKHEALAVSGRFPALDRVPLKVRPTQWKSLAVELSAAFAGDGVKPRIATKAALVYGQATFDWAQQCLVDADTRKQAEFVRRLEPLPVDDDATEQEKNKHAAALAAYEESLKTFANSRLESRIQARHMDAAVRQALFQQGGVAAIQQYEEQLGHQTEMDEEARPAKEAKAREAAAIEKRRDDIKAYAVIEKELGRLTDEQAALRQELLHEEHLWKHKKDLADIKKYTKYVASAEKEIVEIETEGKKRAAKAIELIQKVTIPDSEAELAACKTAVKEADAAYESFRDDNAAEIYKISIKERTPEQNKTIKELTKFEKAKVRARKEMHEVEKKLSGQKARAVKMVEALPHKDELIAECEKRLARNQAKLAEAKEAEKESKKQLEKDNRSKKPKAAKAAAAAESSGSDSEESESDNDEMDESDD